MSKVSTENEWFVLLPLHSMVCTTKAYCRLQRMMVMFLRSSENICKCYFCCHIANLVVTCLNVVCHNNKQQVPKYCILTCVITCIRSLHSGQDHTHFKTIYMNIRIRYQTMHPNHTKLIDQLSLKITYLELNKCMTRAFERLYHVRQPPTGLHVGPLNYAIWVLLNVGQCPWSKPDK